MDQPKGTRNFKNWLDAYCAYSRDGFVPEQFNVWSGISIMAAAMERKVWLPWSDTFQLYPNIYVLLVSLPGAGKSTALNRAVDLLLEMDTKAQKMRIVPSQVTESKFIELMSAASSFNIGMKMHQQSAAFYYASEASNSLRNVYGDFIACLTDFYDCPPRWERATKKDDSIMLRNVCLNLLAGSTFDYLGKLVNDEGIMGGFASRILYVVCREKSIRPAKFPGQTDKDQAKAQARKEFRRKLIEDLAQIHAITGPYSGDAGFAAGWEAWHPAFEARRQALESEKLQSLIARTNTNVLKLSMILSAAESNDRVMTAEHWSRALSLVEENEKEIPLIFSSAQAADTKSQQGINQAIVVCMRNAGGRMTKRALSVKLVSLGFPPNTVKQTLDHMMSNSLLRSRGMLGDSIALEISDDAAKNL